MTHYMIELALWMLLIFLIGCLLGYLLRKLLGSQAPIIEARRRNQSVNRSRQWLRLRRLLLFLHLNQ